MVFRFPIHWVCIFLGLCFCIYGSVAWISGGPKETIANSTFSERPLIIDAGHGGADGGAVGADGTPESSINLEIANKVDTLSHLLGVTSVMTRESEELNYPTDAESIAEKKVADQKARLRLIQDYPYGILCSIHQNTYPSEKISGIQVLYGHSDESREIGILMQNNLNEATKAVSPRVASEISNDIYLLRNCNCTAILIECGFISNPNECRLLQTADYQKKLAAVILATYLQFTMK